MIAKHLDEPSCTTSDRAALLQRSAILEAGFGERAAERAALGGALALHGIDGAQITALQRLDEGESRAAAALFATLLDSTDPARVGAPWALRGHAMAVLDEVAGMTLAGSKASHTRSIPPAARLPRRHQTGADLSRGEFEPTM